MLRTSRSLILLLAVVLGLGASAFATPTPIGSLTITGGERTSGGVWDSGTVTATIDGHSISIAYGQYSTPASIASSLGATISQTCSFPVYAHAVGAVLNFYTKNGSIISSATLSSTSSNPSIFQQGSFSINNAGMPTAAPTLTLATSGTPSANGSAVTFTATISNGVTGTVTFYDSGIIIGSGSISGSTATFSTSSLALGTHTITAGWTGNTSYYGVISSPLTQTVSGPGIANVYPATAMVGDLLELTGSGFGSAQGGSTITVDGLPALAAYWSDGRVVVEVPSGSSNGAVKATVNSMSSGAAFSVAQPGSSSNTCN